MGLSDRELAARRHSESRLATWQAAILMEHEDVVDVIEHPNQGQYPNQKIAVIIISQYAYLVPYVQVNDDIFLKTMIPSRKATKKYLRGEDEEDIFR